MGPTTTQSEDVARSRVRGSIRARGRSGSRRWRVRRAASVAGLALVALFLLAVTERIVFAGDVMPGVEASGVALGGKSEADAFRELSALARRLETEPLRARAGDRVFEADISLLGYDVDEHATLRAARTAARSGNPVEQTIGAVLRRFRPDRVSLRVSYRETALEGVLDGWQASVLDGNVEGGLRFEGTTVVAIEPRAGTGIQRDRARALLDTALRSADRDVVVLPVGRIEPRLTADEVARAAARARALLDGPYVLATLGGSVAITPEQLASAMGTTIDGSRLEVTIDPEVLRAALGDAIAGLERAPTDARFEVTAQNTVQVVPSQNGLQIDMDGVVRAILDGEREIVAPLVEVVPERDTAWAESLGIKEQVSTFTTFHAAGQSRVTNIHRAADLIDNVVVEPGEVFSLNDAIGPRTPERGFVVAPVFYGEFTEDVGGGVSQLATTFFNAVFFGGYEDVFHKPHSIYISRYPTGREATVNYPNVDLKFRNDSSAGILIRTSYTSRSITVTFYGDLEGKTVRAEGPNVLAERPVVDELIPCPAPPEVDTANDCATLTEGETKRIEEGIRGFDVEVFRVIERPGQEPVRERFFWRYRMIPNRVLVGTTPATITVPPDSVPPPGEPPPDAPSTTAAPPAPAAPPQPPPPAP